MELPKVDGRECVPVRLLSYSTGWETLTPDVVAPLFAGLHPLRSWTVAAFMLQPNGSCEPVPAKWWIDTVNNLDLLASSLKDTEHPKWRRESIGLLPGGVFVWRDDFVAEYTRIYLRPEQLRANRGLHSRELNFAPLLSAAERAVVFEGFEVQRAAAVAPVPPESVRLTTAPAESKPGVLADDAPLPLSTGDIAFCFDGLRYTEEKWKKPLGDKPKWLKACVAIPGRQGGSATRWNPVFIGGALVRAGHVRANQVRARFQRMPLLKPWLDAWKTYEADYIESA